MKRIVLLFLFVMSTAAQSQQSAQAETQFVDSHGRRLAYRIVGKGSPVILANRFRGTLDTWDPLFLDELAKHNQVITFDYSGIGYSTGKLPLTLSEVARDVKDLADGLRIGRATLGGWSYGGLVAQVAMLQYPELATHLLLIGTNPLGKNEVPLEPLFLEHALKPVNDFDDETVLFFEPASQQSVKLAKASHDRIYRNLDVSKIPSTREAFDLYIAGSADARDDKSGLRRKFIETKVPVLILSGDHDISFPVENWYRLTRQLSTSQHIVFPHTGHAPQHQFPGLSADYIAGFIRRTK